MEYAEGSTLRHLIDVGGTLPVPVVLSLAIGLALAATGIYYSVRAVDASNEVERLCRVGGVWAPRYERVAERDEPLRPDPVVVRDQYAHSFDSRSGLDRDPDTRRRRDRGRADAPCRPPPRAAPPAGAA